ncbi:uncharacterized protein GIQ15_04963 [Arthroderma uncinatum]|uniref:uncharacterized protein n=1 Tax=Arthroderma uncinatum TaxID=74035 RepID=UPI00144ACF76|nr:uncharacterized protein GIQ15_04963 [Arthroderma uncinatum]KAF3482204.1 hypothetical protein GIQ15_04963 [Arthroderma uncinatum]
MHLQSFIALALLSASAAYAKGAPCRGFAVAPSDDKDTCENFAKRWHITVDRLKELNPDVNCPNLDQNTVYCVNNPDPTDTPTDISVSITTTGHTTASTTATTTTSPSTTTRETATAPTTTSMSTSLTTTAGESTTATMMPSSSQSGTPNSARDTRALSQAAAAYSLAAMSFKKLRWKRSERTPGREANDTRSGSAALVNHDARPNSAISHNDALYKSFSLSPDPLGLTLIHESDNPLVDIIFVHGLGGSSLRTWSYDRDVRNLWLPWLGAETGLSNIRAFTFGYNAHFAEKAGVLSTLDFAKDLLFQIKMYHDEHREQNRPIGDAYIIGKTDDQYSHIISQIYGIVFLGTPHRGSNFASILNNILRIAPTTGTKIYVDELGEGSISINDINEQFRNVCSGLELVSFYETLKTAIAPAVKVMVVEKQSAILGYPSEISAPLDADHNGITKFLNREDGNYRDVRNVLRTFVLSLKQKAGSRLKIIDPKSPVPATLKNVLGIEELGDDLGEAHDWIQPGSCRWILEKKGFQDWIADSSLGLSILWLTGSPGTGKTKLSSFIINYLRQPDFPASCQYYFFKADQRGTRTISHFLWSIAFRAAEAHDDFRQRLLEVHQQSGLLFASQTFNVIWKKLFEGILFRCNFGQRLFWVLDGIDEAESPATIVKLISRIKSVTPIRVLLVSRETREISAALTLDDCRVYHDEIRIDDTVQDIQTFVSTGIRGILPDDKTRENVIEKVLSKASGSFLWTKLALERIKDNWHTDVDVEKALGEIPEDMELMYARMMDTIASQPSNLRKMATEILTWVVCSFKPLSIDELAVALKAEFGGFYNLKTTISQICGNFVIMRKSTVSIIHQTALQFLVNRSLHASISIDLSKGHEKIANVCMNFLSDDKWKSQLSTIGVAGGSFLQDPYAEVPFLSYAITYWAYHVCSAGVESEELQTNVLNFLSRFALVWIYAVSLTGNLQAITRSAQYLRSYTDRATQGLPQIPTSFKHSQNQRLIQWSNDLIRLVGRFASHLVESPSAIYKYIIPFCPSESMLSQTFQHSSQNSIKITGIPHNKWDDRLARLTMGENESPSKVICKDNYFIALLCENGTLVIWNSETCMELRRLHHGEWVTSIKAAKIQNLLASAGTQTIRIWDIGSGREIYKIPKSSPGRVMSLAFKSNDTELLIAYDDSTLYCIDLETLQQKWCFEASGSSKFMYSSPRVMEFSPDTERIAIAHPGPPVHIWRISRHKYPPQRCIRQGDINKSEEDVYNYADAVLWKPDSAGILILYQDTELMDWNIDDDTKMEHSHIFARELAISSDGTLLLTSDYNSILSVWSTNSFRLICRLEYGGFVRDVAFSPDSRRLYDVRDNACNIWEPMALTLQDGPDREYTPLTDHFSKATVSPSNRDDLEIISLTCGSRLPYYCVGKDDGSVTIYETRTAQRLRKLYGHSETSYVADIVWSSSQKYIASVDRTGQVIAKRLGKPTPKAPQKWAVYPLLDLRLETNVIQVLFSSSEEYLLISIPHSDEVWDIKSKEKLVHAERGNRSYHRRWVNHPKDMPSPRLSSTSTDDETLVEEINRTTLGGALADSTAIHPFKRVREALEHVFQVNDHCLVLDYVIASGLHNDPWFHSNSSRRLEIIDLNDVQLRRRALLHLSSNVNRLVGVFQRRLVFLNHQYWLCTWELDSDEDSYKRHFFLPKDWILPETLDLVTIDYLGNLVCPKGGKIAIIQSGIKL